MWLLLLHMGGGSTVTSCGTEGGKRGSYMHVYDSLWQENAPVAAFNIAVC